MIDPDPQGEPSGPPPFDPDHEPDSFEDPTDSWTVHSDGETPESPPRKPANAIELRVVAGTVHGFYNLRVDLCGRYSCFPGALFVVAVARDTGQVRVGHLANWSEMPPRYLGANAPPSMVRLDVPPGVGGDMSEIGFFRVDLRRHLVLGAAPDVFDVFLWLEDLASDMATCAMPAGDGGARGPAFHERPAAIATVRRACRSDRLDLALRGRSGERAIVGRSGVGHVSLVAYSVASRTVGWTALRMDRGGLTFKLKVRDLLPDADPDERVLVFAIADGRRSALLDSARG